MFIFIQLIRQILKQPSLSAWVQSARYINQWLTSRDIPNTIHIPIGRYKFYIIIIIFIFVIYFYNSLEVFFFYIFLPQSSCSTLLYCSVAVNQQWSKPSYNILLKKWWNGSWIKHQICQACTGTLTLRWICTC